MPQPTLEQAFQIALQHQQAGRLEQAEQLYHQILERHPSHFEALNALGMIHGRLGRRDAAIDCFRRAISIKPESAQSYYNLAVTLQAGARLDEAIAAYRQTVTLNPNFAEAHSNLGVALQDKGELEAATAAYRLAIALKPGSPQVHNNLGNVLKDTGRLDEAIAAFRQAIVLNPNYPRAHSNLGNALKETGRLGDAIAAYRQAIVLEPSFAEAHDNLLLILHYDPASDARSIAQEHRRWNREQAEPLKGFIPAHANDRDPDRVLRIGYVSPDFKEHVVGQNLLPLFRRHDRRQFHITCYAHVGRPDGMTAEFQKNADAWRNIAGLSDEDVCRQVRSDRIDILLDLSLHSANNRLLVFARKPAPVQATFAGYPGSTGLSTIDYRLSDPYLDPPGMNESIYSEKTIRLPDSFWCYDPLYAREIPVNRLHAQSLSRGPALSSVTFGCLNNFYKVNEPQLKLWARVLREVENSRLILLAKQGSHRQRTLDFLTGEGIDPARVEFVPHQPHRQYMELYHRIDIGLDTFPYNGHTTSLDSYWMGVPVVTLVGQQAASRAGWCQLSNLGLTELAAHTPDQFVQIAMELAKDLPRLSELRSTLRRRMEQSPLMDAQGFARNIEAAYRLMWRRWCASAG